MGTTHLEELLTVVFGAPGFFLLLWAISARQFRGSESAKFAVDGTDEAPPAGATARMPSRRKSRLAFAAILAVFFLLSVCPVVLTLVMVAQGLSAERAHSAPKAMAVKHKWEKRA